LLRGFSSLLRRSSLLMLLPLRLALLPALLLVLRVDRGGGPEKQKQNCCADDGTMFHRSVLLLSATVLSVPSSFGWMHSEAVQ
jgi:hypothetical protein